MKLRIPLTNGYQDWNVNAKCRRVVKPLAAQFAISVEEFLRLYSRNELPNQPIDISTSGRKPKIPKGFDLNLGIGPTQKRLHLAAQFKKQPVAEFVWSAVASWITCSEEDMIFCPMTGVAVGRKSDLFGFQLGSKRDQLWEN